MDEASLMTAFDFDADDLFANQHGRLSDRQTRRLGESDRSAVRTGMFLLLLGIAGPIAAIVAAAMTPRVCRDHFLRHSGGHHLAGDLDRCRLPHAEGSVQNTLLKVASTRGRARIVRHTSPSGAEDEAPIVDYELQIADQVFDVEPGMTRAIVADDDYIVYYLEATSDILSVEVARQRELVGWPPYLLCGLLHHPHQFEDQLFERRQVHVIQPLDVQAHFAGLVLAKLGQ